MIKAPEKLEVFLLLALKKSGADKQGKSVSFHPNIDLVKNTDLDEKRFSAVFEQLNEDDTGAFRRLLEEYQNKPQAEKDKWKKEISSSIGEDELPIDVNVHQSHIDAVLSKESPAIQKILSSYLNPEAANKNNNFDSTSSDKNANRKLIEKVVKRSFSKQFVRVEDIASPTAFDYLSGAQLVRLIRLSGIREVTFACARIEAVESVAAFLRRFSSEDARAIATQLNNLPKMPAARLLAAENAVQIALEAEQNPSAMLDLLGLWSIAINLCRSPEKRILYTKQKLPVDIATELPEIIKNQCRKTTPELQKQISSEVESLAETIIKTSQAVNPNV